MLRRSRRILGTLVAAFLVAGVAAACTSFQAAEPGGPGLAALDDWVTGRTKIWDLAFPAGGQAPLFTENDSGVIFARWSGSERARPLGAVTQFDSTFDPTGEGGLMGIALSPGFDGSTNHRAFVCYSTTSDNRVARFDVNYAAGAFGALSNWTPIITGLPHSSIHDGCRVRFQPGTGALFVTTGDATTATGPQSTTVLAGKILRVDQDGNPWPGNASGARWYTRGHRNPQGLAFRPGSNDPYSIEHGPDVNDEVNKLVNGANSGWNPVNGSGGYDQSKAMTDTSIEPGKTMTPVWQSGGVTVAPSGGTFLSGVQWKNWDGALVVACLDGSPDVGQRLLVMHLDTGGTTLAASPVTALSRGIRLRSAVQGPDGNLYVVTDGVSGAGAIWLLTPS
ncbi:MAG TPA: PQQ-dependent sugar dehydrogenase [Acidimicrobiia bacterium]|nr:PQQ-dependent sugar dehydrogenase [Acidimicrobiia bacterium]